MTFVLGEVNILKMMNVKPEKPAETDCCNSGCNPCIFDVYEQQLKRWEKSQCTTQASSVSLNESRFSPFLIKTIDVMTPDIKIFEFQSVKLISCSTDEVLISQAECNIQYDIVIDSLNLKAGHYLILKGQYEVFNDNTGTVIKKISRSYTPVLSHSKKGTFKIIVKIYPDGKMSQFLNRLHANDIVFWRGPYKEFVYHTNSYIKVLLVGGGTGAIPLYNIAKEIVENDVEETSIKFLASFKNIESFILRDELYQLQQYWNFNIDIYITNQTNQKVTLKYNEHVVFSKLNEAMVTQELCNHKKDKSLILICGPESFKKFIYSIVMQCGVPKENIYIFKYLYSLYF